MTSTLDEGLQLWRKKLEQRGLVVGEPLPREDTETEQDRTERLELQHANRMARSARQVPAHYRSAVLDDLTNREGAQMSDWWESTSPTLLLVGNIGAGKTHAAYALRNQVAAQCVVASFHMADVLHALRPEGDPADIRDLRTASLLLLDDLGTTRMTDWALAELDALIDERTRRDLRQIVTTNMTSAQLREHLGERATSRLTAGAVVIPFTGPDRRQLSW